MFRTTIAWNILHKSIDKDNMYAKVYNFPEFFGDAIKISLNNTIRLDGEIKEIVACGMGGSAISLDFSRTWLLDKIKVPFTIVRDYYLPNHVNKNSLVIISSYSGKTEETISCLKESIERKAKIIAISSNGEVEELCKQNNLPFIKIPSGLPPRSAFPYLFVPIPFILATNDLLNDKEKILSELNSVPEVLRSIRNLISVEAEEKDNDAKKLAKTLVNAVPIVYGYSLMGVVALRFKQQLNENAKSFAIANVFPELNHNEFEGARFLGISNAILILLRSSQEPAKIKKRIEVTKEILSEFIKNIIELRAPNDSLLKEALILMFKLDMASVYLAWLKQVDPSPTPSIDRLKVALSNGSS